MRAWRFVVQRKGHEGRRVIIDLARRDLGNLPSVRKKSLGGKRSCPVRCPHDPRWCAVDAQQFVRRLRLMRRLLVAILLVLSACQLTQPLPQAISGSEPELLVELR